MKDKLKKLIFLTLLMVLLVKAGPVFSQEIIYPNLPGVEEPQDFIDTAPAEDIFGLWIKYIIALATWSSGLIAFLVLIAAGIRLLTSAGDPEKVIESRKQIIGAFVGIALILSAYFILEIMSPFFVNFTLPEIEDIADQPDLPASALREQHSSLDVYVPVGRIIETIFETYISDPKREPDEPTRILRITNNLDATLDLLPEILEHSNKIAELSRECKCFDVVNPDPRCDPAGCGTCNPRFCTSDPCESTREEIVQTEQELLPYLFGDILVNQKTPRDRVVVIPTNLTKELAKTEEEIRLLKYWFDKLGRAEQFIRECDYLSLNNSNQYLSKKDDFDSKGKEWFIEGISFYDDVSIVYNKPLFYTNMEERWLPEPDAVLRQTLDESTLYCSVGGNYIAQPTDFDIDLIEKDEFSKNEEEKAFENLFHYEKACDVTIPYGEVLDKAHRMTRLLINKLELIADREKNLLELIEELQVLVSHCSSRLCFPLCICVTPAAGPQFCIEVGCFGPACPDGEIRSKISRIRSDIEEIQTAINGLAPFDIEETMGVKPMFEFLVVDLLEGMERTLRTHMTKCFYERPGVSNIKFMTCREMEGSTDEIGYMVIDCCEGTNEEWQDTEYGQCLDHCYLRKITSPSADGYYGFRYSAYSACMEGCLIVLGEEIGDENIPECGHSLNFHCCFLKKEE